MARGGNPRPAARSDDQRGLVPFYRPAPAAVRRRVAPAADFVPSRPAQPKGPPRFNDKPEPMLPIGSGPYALDDYRLIKEGRLKLSTARLAESGWTSAAVGPCESCCLGTFHVAPEGFLSCVKCYPAARDHTTFVEPRLVRAPAETPHEPCVIRDTAQANFSSLLDRARDLDAKARGLDYSTCCVRPAPPPKKKGSKKGRWNGTRKQRRGDDMPDFTD